MQGRRRLILPLLLLTLPLIGGPLASAPARAESWKLRLDPAASTLEFSVGATLHTVRGKARFEPGEITYDSATGSASGEIVVDAKSFDTANSGRDKNLHSMVLESVKFPHIGFEPTRIEGSVPGQNQIAGTMRIHGAEHPFEVAGRSTQEGDRVTLETSFAVPYVSWGLTDPSSALLRVAKEVQVRVKWVGTRVPPAPGAAGASADR